MDKKLVYEPVREPMIVRVERLRAARTEESLAAFKAGRISIEDYLVKGLRFSRKEAKVTKAEFKSKICDCMGGVAFPAGA